MKQKRVRKRIPSVQHTPHAGNAKKSLLFIVLTLFVVGVIAVLLIFGKQFAGQAIGFKGYTPTGNEGGVFTQEIITLDGIGDFGTIPVQVYTSVDSSAVAFTLTYDSSVITIDCPTEDLLDNVFSNGELKLYSKVSCDPGTISYEYVGLPFEENKISKAKDVVELKLTAVAEKTTDLKFTFDAYDVDGNKLTVTPANAQIKVLSAADKVCKDEIRDIEITKASKDIVLDNTNLPTVLKDGTWNGNKYLQTITIKVDPTTSLGTGTLIVSKDSQIMEYTITFTDLPTDTLSGAQDTTLDSFVNTKVELLGKDYTITKATREITLTKGISLTLTSGTDTLEITDYDISSFEKGGVHIKFNDDTLLNTDVQISGLDENNIVKIGAITLIFNAGKDTSLSANTRLNDVSWKLFGTDVNVKSVDKEKATLEIGKFCAAATLLDEGDKGADDEDKPTDDQGIDIVSLQSTLDKAYKEKIWITTDLFSNSKPVAYRREMRDGLTTPYVYTTSYEEDDTIDSKVITIKNNKYQDLEKKEVKKKKK